MQMLLVGPTGSGKTTVLKALPLPTLDLDLLGKHPEGDSTKWFVDTQLLNGIKSIRKYFMAGGMCTNIFDVLILPWNKVFVLNGSTDVIIRRAIARNKKENRTTPESDVVKWANEWKETFTEITALRRDHITLNWDKSIGQIVSRILGIVRIAK